MRYLLSAVFIAALIAGFLPRPLFIPDWRTPYEKALAAEDCDALERARTIQAASSNTPGRSEITIKMYQKELCGLTHDLNIGIAWMEALASSPTPSFINRAKRSSFLWPRISQEIDFLHNRSQNQAIRISQRRTITHLKTCAAVLTSDEEHPNYQFMKYALDNDQLTRKQIVKLSQKQDTACVRLLLSEALFMFDAAITPDDYKTAIEHAYQHGSYAFLAPELANLLIAQTESLPAEIKAANQTILPYNSEFEGFDVSTQAFCALRYQSSILAASFCAKEAADDMQAHPNAAIFALYYALRAERLGWIDIPEIKNNAKATLTPECTARVVALEERYAKLIGDSGNMDVLDDAFELANSTECAV